ncbi:hypothetical protein ACH5RR_036235 [Cinchona calisaya]|uniref:Uncharacterized protein n=1 Tax=Cinchona calisaya TaxID=153742 RepID=A0ABD2Y2K9_9GENT
MAYFEFIFLVMEVNNFLRFALRLLNIKKLQAKLFIEKVDEILKMLGMEGTTTLPEQEVEMILSLALPIEHVPGRPDLRALRSSNANYISTTDNPWMVLGEVPEIVQQINFIMETQLKKFLDDTDFYNKWEDLRNNLGLLPTREAVRNLLQASQELKEAINFFHEVGTETTVLCQYLKFLQSLLTAFQLSNDGHVDKELLISSIKHVLKAISPKEFRNMAWPSGFRKDVLSEYGYSLGQCSVKIKANCNIEEEANWNIEEEAKNILEGKNGLRLALLETLGKLDSFKGDISMICEKLGREDFQSWNAPISISQPWCPSVSAFPSAEERKGKERKGKEKQAFEKKTKQV